MTPATKYVYYELLATGILGDIQQESLVELFYFGIKMPKITRPVLVWCDSVNSLLYSLESPLALLTLFFLILPDMCPVDVSVVLYPNPVLVSELL